MGKIIAASILLLLIASAAATVWLASADIKPATKTVELSIPNDRIPR
jgi:hypothetical protein